MLQAFIIMMREGFESFLLVAVIITYLKKTKRNFLIPAAYWGIFLSILASLGLGYLLQEGAGKSLWEGIFGLITIFLVGSMIIHMWIHAPRIKAEMEGKLAVATSQSTIRAAWIGVLVLTVVMIAREGFETVIMLIQVKEAHFTAGILLGILAAAAISYVWGKWSYLINVKRFFQFTGLYLLLFLFQVGIYSFHEFAEAGVLPNSEALHKATEVFSPDGLYGKWFSVIILGISTLWLFGAWLVDKFGTQTKKA